VIESSVKDLKAELGVKRKETSLAEEWKTSRPSGVKEEDINTYLQEVRHYHYTSSMTDIYYKLVQSTRKFSRWVQGEVRQSTFCA
jgi:protein associated with RNAse G/E